MAEAGSWIAWGYLQRLQQDQHPWSPSTMGTGSDLYWNLSLWSECNAMLMRTDITKV
jgi:hypothetical protein